MHTPAIKSSLPYVAVLLVAVAHTVCADVPVTANPNHEAMLAIKDPVLARNKRLVYDWLREVWEAGHLELAPKYIAEDYIQHNPKQPSGLKGYVEHFSKIREPKPIEARVKVPLVSVTAERDLVTVAFAIELPEPDDPSKTYTTTWFDLYRIEDGRIAEHWDGAMKGSMPWPKGHAPRAPQP